MLLNGSRIFVTRFVLIGGILLMIGMSGGCSKGTARPDAVKVAGKVTTADGAPVSGVQLILAPDNGIMLDTAAFDLDPEGHFEGQALPGSYGYYFVPLDVKMSENGGPADKNEAKKLHDSTIALNKLVPPALRAGEKNGTKGKVQVTPGAEIALVLSK